MITLTSLLLLTLCVAQTHVDAVNEVTRRLLTSYQYPFDVQELAGTCENAEIEFARLYADAMGICALSLAKITPPTYCRKATWDTSVSCFEETPGLTTRYVDSCCVTEGKCLEEIFNQWLGLLDGLHSMFSWGFGDVFAKAPTAAAEWTVEFIDKAIAVGLTVAETAAENTDAAVLKPFAESKLALKTVLKDYGNEDLLMEIAQGYLDENLGTDKAYEYWNEYPTETRETILATACRQAASNALRGDESMEKLRRQYEEHAKALEKHEPEFGFNVPDCLKLRDDASYSMKVSCAKQIMDTVTWVDSSGIFTIMNAFTYETCPSIYDPNEPSYNPRASLREDHPWHKIKGQMRNQLNNRFFQPADTNDRGDADSVLTQLKEAMLPQSCVQYVKGVCRPANHFSSTETGYALATFATRSLIALDQENTQSVDYCCPAGFREVRNEADCRAAHAELNIAHSDFGGSVNSNERPYGCLLNVETDTVQFNHNQRPRQILGLDEVICKRGVGAKGEGFIVSREIRGYRMGREGKVCPTGQKVLLREDCQYAVNEFTDTSATLDNFVDNPDLPSGCSYNVETHRGQWNGETRATGAGNGATNVEPICYNKDDITVTQQKHYCYIDEVRQWDSPCCAWGMDYCPSGYDEVGVAPDVENNVWYLPGRFFRVCWKEICECPAGTRAVETVNWIGQTSTQCVSRGSFHGDNSKNCFTEGKDTATRDAQCPGDMYCDVDAQDCKHPRPFNHIEQTPAFNTEVGGLCTCPNGQVYGVGSSRNDELACYGGVTTEIEGVSNVFFDANVVCTDCKGSKVSVACGKMSKGMTFGVLSETEAWMGVAEGAQNANEAIATFEFYCSESVDAFRFSSLAYAPDGGSNSFWVKIDNGRFLTWGLYKNSNRIVNTSPNFGAVSVGTHTLTIRRREDGTYLSDLLMQNDACEFVVDNTQESEREDFAFVKAGCGGSAIEAEWTMEFDSVRENCADACNEHEECVGFELGHDNGHHCRYYADFNLRRNSYPLGCFIKHTTLTQPAYDY